MVTHEEISQPVRETPLPPHLFGRIFYPQIRNEFGKWRAQIIVIARICLYLGLVRN